MENYSLYIGIDPGVNTGVALWYPATRVLQLLQFKSHCEALICLLDTLRKMDAPRVKFRIEDARKAKARPDLAEINKGKLQGVGYVKAYSKDWEEFCKLHGWPYELLPPGLTKVSPQFFEGMTGIKTLKTESHKRDAGMLVYGR